VTGGHFLTIDLILCVHNFFCYFVFGFYQDITLER